MPPLRWILAAACVLALAPRPARSAPTLLIEPHRRDGTVTRETLPPGHGLEQILGDGGVVRSRTVDPDAPLRVIVEFQAAPVVAARRLGLDAALPARTLERLRSDLARLASTAPGGPALAQVTHEYTQVFSGAAVTISPTLLDRLRALGYVRRVVPDDSVHTTLDQSVPLIGADRVRIQLGGTGAGIRVGIIDTGIDYNHPAFGGGFGPGHRVAGGWDFANDDPDPADDNGHGTHVAGIVAGNGGGVVGVAPQATLYAFKALDSQGSGFRSWVLAALDRVLDPDGDPATDDAMRVVNISLSVSGGVDDPLSLAVDRLTEAGVVCAVAAGNSPRYFGVAAPGAARQAITVGASTKNDTIAGFSSWGPATGGFFLKPDLVAPGANIVSAAWGGGRRENSGTSMAAPHVAGVAAQLLQLHPQWTPEIVKSAIVGTARDLLRPAFVQGAGRLDAYRAATARYVISPSSLSFGNCDAHEPSWSRTDTLHVTNLSGAPLTVWLTPPDFQVEGANLSLTPGEVSVPAGGTASVAARLTVDNDATPFPTTAPYGYDGTVVASADGDTCRVPVSFHKVTVLSVAPTSRVEWLIVHDRSRGGYGYSSTSSSFVLLPPGTYDVMAALGSQSTFVVREGVRAEGGDLPIAIDPSEATARIDFANVGPDGAPLHCNRNILALFDTRTGWGFLYTGVQFDQVRVSPTSSNYRLEWFRSQTGPRDRIAVSGGLSGIGVSQTITNRPDDLRHVAMHFPAPLVPASPLIFDYTPLRVSPPGYQGWAIFDPSQAAITDSMTYDQWFTAPPWEDHVEIGTRIELVERRAGSTSPGPKVEIGPLLRLDRGWPIEGYLTAFSDPPWFTFDGEHMTLGAGMPVWRGRFQNSGHAVMIDGGPRLAAHPFADMYGAMAREPDPEFTIRSTGSGSAPQDTMRGAGGFGVGGISRALPSPGEYDLHTFRAYTLRGRPARLDVDAHMDTRLADPDPPWLYSLQLFADGSAADSIAFDAVRDAGLRFRMLDVDAIAPSVSVRAGSVWSDLPVSMEGDEFIARLPGSLEGPIALRLAAHDASGNSVAFTWDPGFVAAPGSPPRGATLALAGAWPNPAPGGMLPVRFSLSGSTPATLALYDVTGREVVAHEVGFLGPGDHVLDVAAGRSLRSGIYFLRLAQDGRVLTSRACVIR